MLFKITIELIEKAHHKNKRKRISMPSNKRQRKYIRSSIKNIEGYKENWHCLFLENQSLRLLPSTATEH